MNVFNRGFFRAVLDIGLSLGLAMILATLAGVGLLLIWNSATDADVFDAPWVSVPRFEILRDGEPIRPPDSLLDAAIDSGLAERASVGKDDGTPVLVLRGAEFDDARAFIEARGFDVGRVFRVMTQDYPAVVGSILSTPWIVNTFLAVQVALMAGIALSRMRRHSFAAGWRALNLRVAGWSVVFGLVALGGSEAMAWILSLAGLEVREQPWVETMLDGGFATSAASYLFVGLLGPVAEELFFRGFAFSLLLNRTAPWAAYVVSAAMFAGIHMNPTGTPIYFLYGLLLAWAYRRSGTLWAPIIMHTLVNVVALTVAASGV